MGRHCVTKERDDRPKFARKTFKVKLKRNSALNAVDMRIIFRPTFHPFVVTAMKGDREEGSLLTLCESVQGQETSKTDIETPGAVQLSEDFAQ